MVVPINFETRKSVFVSEDQVFVRNNFDHAIGVFFGEKTTCILYLVYDRDIH